MFHCKPREQENLEGKKHRGGRRQPHDHPGGEAAPEQQTPFLFLSSSTGQPNFPGILSAQQQVHAASKNNDHRNVVPQLAPLSWPGGSQARAGIRPLGL